MISHIANPRTNVRLLAVVLAATVLSGSLGCASWKKGKMFESRTTTRPDDSAFAAGAGRAPTPATSHAFARILINQGRDRDALYVLSRICREHPSYLPAYNDMANVYVRSDRIEDAIAALNAGLKHSANDPVLQNNLGMCHLLNDDHEAALQSFTLATQAMPNNPTFRANRATALGLLGRKDEAESEYRTVLDKRTTRRNVDVLVKAHGEINPQPKEDAGEQKSDAGEESVPAEPEPAPAAEIEAQAPVSANLEAINPALAAEIAAEPAQTDAPAESLEQLTHDAQPVDAQDESAEMDLADDEDFEAEPAAATFEGDDESATEL